ncbi:RNA polymerase sigma factor [Patiriisocius hiemis]|uniref:Sigma-70 family RNA polymerase sigma factor n=1 Tax=Patiriisocius hiemis TaxID=3075604 RepID=A0ABU2YCA7_9FLAO|nr:sigma-70 family RNA polymerase sigma factor [Constantimarinum sp. W242]MDT0555392.1 sigma-70 family RNA polymerase sigma factor [Constantimarinum sp. W242]
MENTEATLQERLRADDKKALEEVYIAHKEVFLSYASSFNVDRDVLLDIYQDSVIALFQNFVRKQTVLEKSTVKTYLFGIAKNKLYTYLKAQKRLIVTNNSFETFEEIKSEEQELTREQRLLAKYFDEISTSCQHILKLFYYRSLSIKEIVSMTQYKDENTVKSHKSRCLKRLTELIKNN